MKSKLVVKKSEVMRQVIYAEVYAPLRLDSDKEFMTEDDIMTMAHNFMREMRQFQVDHGHTNEIVEGACVVESFIARDNDPDFIKGAWVVGVHIPDPADWTKVLDGTWNGFSMEAEIFREEVEVTLDLPPVLNGATLGPIGEAEEHTHTFLVAYDTEGNFLGGRTDIAEGHFHYIKKGTITEEVDGHHHRFSHLDELMLDVPA